MRYIIAKFIFVFLIVIGLTSSAFSQLLPKAEDTATPPAATDSFGRLSPRGTVEGYLRAIGSDDFQRAANYIDVSNEPLGDRRTLSVLRARQLKQLLDRDGYFLETSALSAQPNGKQGDELAAGVDQVGVLDRSKRQIPVLVHRIAGQDGTQIWMFSPDVLKRLPFLLRVSDEGLLDQYLPDYLKDKKIGTVPIGHWLAIAVAALAALLIGWLISLMIVGVGRKLLEKRTEIPGRGVLSSIVIPLAVLIGVSIYRFAVSNLGIQVVAREQINWIAIILSWLALAWLGSRIIDGIADIVRFSMSRTNRTTSLAVVMLARRMAKLVVMAIAAITILDILGVDVTTGLAALGIGGLALALGAQKTIENLVGSVTVVADKPVRVGDFCKFGEVTGTVEEIGIRSTRIRTLDRTLVTVPNGAFSSMQIENYAMRDEFKLETTLTLRYETTPDQIRYLLAEIRALLIAHEHVSNKPARVRFTTLNTHSIDILIFTYVRAPNYDEFLEIQENILLRIMDIVAEAGADFAFPSQTVYLARDAKPSFEKAEEVSKRLFEKEQKEGPVHRRFTAEQIEALNDTIPFPR